MLGCSTANTTTDVPEKIIEDADGDGFSSEEDCDDSNSLVSPAAEEVCDGADNNCDGQIDEDVQTDFFADSDLDGFGNPTLIASACEAPSGFVSNGSDCDDTDENSYPGAEEICDDVDNNCNEEVDEGLGQMFYTDADGDGFGNEASPVQACEIQEGLSTIAEDCDDGNAQIFPEAQEQCNGVDDKHGEVCAETFGKVKKCPSIMGAAFGRPHKGGHHYGWLLLYSSSCLRIFGLSSWLSLDINRHKSDVN